MTVTTPEGTHLTARPEIIVTVLKQADHDTERICMTNHDYMIRVKEDVKRLHGIDLSTETPEAFLHSLAQHNLITIEDAA